MSNENDDFLNALLKVLELKPKVTVVIEHSQVHGGSGFGGGGGFGGGVIEVGDAIGGGGFVTGVTETSVTVNFPSGVPKGPIELPGVDTTIVVKESVTQEADSIATLAPWGPDDILTLPSGMEGPEEGVVLADGLHKSFILPCPGSLTNTVRLPLESMVNPTNTGNCPCLIFLGSIDANGKIMQHRIMLEPGKSVPFFEPEPGAVAIVAACSSGCSQSGCVSELTISLGVS